MASAKLISSYEFKGTSEKNGKPFVFFTAILALDGLIVKATTDEATLATLKDKVGTKFNLYKQFRATESGTLVESYYLGEEKIKKVK